MCLRAPGCTCQCMLGGPACWEDCSQVAPTAPSSGWGLHDCIRQAGALIAYYPVANALQCNPSTRNCHDSCAHS